MCRDNERKRQWQQACRVNSLAYIEKGFPRKWVAIRQNTNSLRTFSVSLGLFILYSDDDDAGGDGGVDHDADVIVIFITPNPNTSSFASDRRRTKCISLKKATTIIILWL